MMIIMKKMSHMIRKTTRMVANKIKKETTVMDKMKIIHKKERTMMVMIMKKRMRRIKIIMMVMKMKMIMMEHRRVNRISRVKVIYIHLLMMDRSVRR